LAPLGFVPIVAETPASAPDPTSPSPSPPSIEVEVAGAVLRVTAGTDADLLGTVGNFVCARS
jgi:hypothetical protein